jgi:hypothetical protein
MRYSAHIANSTMTKMSKIGISNLINLPNAGDEVVFVGVLETVTVVPLGVRVAVVVTP